MGDRLAELLERHGQPHAEVDYGASQGSSWRLQERIYLLHAQGHVTIEGARWATERMSQIVADEYGRRGRRIYIAWSFEGILDYGTTVGLHFVDWFKTHRAAVNRFMMLTENQILRMTARTASIAIPSSGLRFPSTAAEFDEELAVWIGRLQRRLAATA